MTATFAELHRSGPPLVLPNVWDAASAKIVERAGFPAVATSSAGVAWALGYADGEAVDPAEMIAAIARIVRCVNVPVTADIEAGYSADIEGLLRTIDGVIGAGAAGINLEDWNAHAGAPFSLDVAAARVAAIKRHAGERLFVNARTDYYLRNDGDAAARFETTLDRLHAFTDAGADGVFVPGVTDATTIGRLAQATATPLNVLADASLPPLPELERLGVARVSFGSWPMRHALSGFQSLANSLMSLDRFDMVARPGSMPYAEANALFTTRMDDHRA